jgi:hypothetical protein
MTSIKNVIVAGASGGVGPSIISALVSNGFTVSVLTRESSTAIFSDDIKVYKTDYSAPSLLKALKGQDAVSPNIPEHCFLFCSGVTGAVGSCLESFPPTPGIIYSQPHLGKVC